MKLTLNSPGKIDVNSRILLADLALHTEANEENPRPSWT